MDRGLAVDSTPKQYSDGKSLHGIYSEQDNVEIPFHLHGSTSYFVTRLPTKVEKQNCRWVSFTSDREWNPKSDRFENAERAMREKINMKSLDYKHHDRDGKCLDFRELCEVTSERHTSAMEGDNVLLDPLLVTFDLVYNIAMTRSVHQDVATIKK